MHDMVTFEASVASDHATKIAERLDCNIENATTIVNCLSRTSTSALVKATTTLVQDVSNNFSFLFI